MIPPKKKRSNAYWRSYAYFIDCKGDDAWMRSASNRREYNDFLLGKMNAEKDLLDMEKSFVPNSKLFEEELDRLIANNPAWERLPLPHRFIPLPALFSFEYPTPHG